MNRRDFLRSVAASAFSTDTFHLVGLEGTAPEVEAPVAGKIDVSGGTELTSRLEDVGFLTVIDLNQFHVIEAETA